MSFRLLSAAVVSLALLAACNRPAPAARDESPRPVRAVTLVEQRSALAWTLPAEVRARVETRYGFRVGGKLASREVELGDRVGPGQVLARLDPQDRAPALAVAQSQLDAARTEARLARVELGRQRELHALRFVSAAQVDRQQAVADASEARVRAARAALEQAGNELAFQTLRADVPGVVTAIEAEAGQVVAAGQPVVRVARSGDRELLAHVAERDLAAVRSVRRWSATIPALGERSFAVTLRELSPVADPASRTYAMRLAIAEPDAVAGIALGMSAVVHAASEAPPAFELPLSALVSRDGIPRVWRLRADDTVELVEVRTAGFLDEAVRVVGGVASGDRIVTAGAGLLVAGERVRPLPDAAARPARPPAASGAPAAATDSAAAAR